MEDGNWLVDPSRRGTLTGSRAEVTEADRKVLRALGERLATIAALPVHAETASNWRALNGLRQVKPMVWIDEVPWHEMDVDDELRLQTTSEWSRYHEWELRKLIYQWEHMPADMVVEPVVYSPARGPQHRLRHRRGRGHRRHRRSQFGGLPALQHPDTRRGRPGEDQGPGGDPRPAPLRAATPKIGGDFRRRHRGQEARGANGFCFWFAPWDEMIRWWGVQEAMVDLYDRPEFVHKAIDKLVNAYLSMLDQFEQQNLLTLNNAYYRIGSGGLGYTDELPPPDYDPEHVRAKDLWGSGAAQIFSDVSPRMHWEFSLQYEMRWMSRFGLTYYGCCDPLHRKMGILEKIPNLRKVSMSPWVDLDQAVANVGGRYVFSHKPNPAVFAETTWHLDKARHDLETVLTRPRRTGAWSR